MSELIPNDIDPKLTRLRLRRLLNFHLSACNAKDNLTRLVEMLEFGDAPDKQRFSNSPGRIEYVVTQIKKYLGWIRSIPEQETKDD